MPLPTPSLFDTFYSPQWQAIFLDIVRNGYVWVVNRFVKAGLIHPPPDPTVLEWKDARALFVHTELKPKDDTRWHRAGTLRFHDLDRFSQPNWAALGVAGETAALLLRRCRELPLCTDVCWRYRNLHAHPKQLAPLNSWHAVMLCATGVTLIELDANLSLDPEDKATLKKALTTQLPRSARTGPRQPSPPDPAPGQPARAKAASDGSAAADTLPLLKKLTDRISELDSSTTSNILPALKTLSSRVSALEATFEDRTEDMLSQIKTLPNALATPNRGRETPKPETTVSDTPKAIPETGPLDRTQAARLLYARRDKIQHKYQVKPWENVLQGPIIQALLNCPPTECPSNTSDWQQIEAIAERYRRHQTAMDRQLADQGKWILNVLQRYHATRSRSN